MAEYWQSRQEQALQQTKGLTVAPVSKHRAGRQKPMGKRDRRWRTRTRLLRIQEYLNEKAIREAVDV